MEDDGLFAIEVDADDYAETAAGDAPSVPRTFQSEENWQAQKAGYTAKTDNGNHYAHLINSIPVLSDSTKVPEKVRLSKTDVHLLGYAVGEMYYDQQYDEILKLCDRVDNSCVFNEKLKVEESLQRWRERCRRRLSAQAQKQKQTES